MMANQKSSAFHVQPSRRQGGERRTARSGGMRLLCLSFGLTMVLGACAPTPQASPTAAPAKPTTAPAAPAASPAASPKPAASPAASPAAAAPAASKPAAASIDPSLASVWQGKTVTVVVTTAAGGGTDTIARVVARHLGRYLPGNPNIIVQNMPGAGNRVGTNFVYAAAPDGLTIGAPDRGVPGFQLQGEGPEQGVRFDVTKMGWLGSLSVASQVLMVHQRAGVTAATLKQLETKPVQIGHSTPGDSPHVPHVVLNHVLGWKLKTIFGYEGSTGRLLGIERGEVDGIITTWDTLNRQKGEEIRNKTMLPLVVIGRKIEDPQLAGIPTTAELFADKGVEAQQLLQVVTSPYEWARPLVMPPGMDPKVLATMRAAMMAVAEDAQFQADARQIELDLAPITGERVQELITQFLQTPKSVLDKLEELVTADSP